MVNFVQKVTKYIVDNPNIVLLSIVILSILIIWLYLKSKNIISGFSSKKSNKNKLAKKHREDDHSDNEESLKPNQKKNEPDPAIAQLVKDINQNS